MRALREIVGLPVLLDGACIGHVLCGEPDPSLKWVCALWISAGHMGERRIGREHVLRTGEVAVIVDDRGIRGRHAGGYFFRRAISTAGERLGAIVDAEFDDSLKICALWLTHGYPDDLRHGRRKITRYTVRENDGAVLVPSGEEDET